MGRILALISAAAVAIVSPGLASAQSTSVWSEIQSGKKLIACVVPAYQPYSWKDASGTWHGFAVEMAKDV